MLCNEGKELKAAAAAAFVGKRKWSAIEVGVTVAELYMGTARIGESTWSFVVHADAVGDVARVGVEVRGGGGNAGGVGVLEVRRAVCKLLRGLVGEGGGVAALEESDSSDFRRCSGERVGRTGDGVRLRFSATLTVLAVRGCGSRVIFM